MARGRGREAFDAVSANGFPSTFQLNGYQVSVQSGSFSPDELVVELHGVTVTKAGTKVPLDPHVRWVNPPMLVADEAGTIPLRGQMWRRDPGAVILRDLLELIRRVDR